MKHWRRFLLGLIALTLAPTLYAANPCATGGAPMMRDGSGAGGTGLRPEAGDGTGQGGTGVSPGKQSGGDGSGSGGTGYTVEVDGVITGFASICVNGLELHYLIDGVLALVAGTRTKIWSLGFIGVVGVLAGVGTFMYPQITALVLLYFIAFWAIVTGVTGVYLAIRLRKELTGEWVLALAGLLSAAFGVMLIARPGAGALTVVFLIASYAVAYGVLLLWLGFKLKGLPNRVAAA
jgi:uncharacterized membrane protein HdeD (DUF308 family)